MKRTAALTALMMLAMGLVPMAAGNHLSVGNQDAVGMSPQETSTDKSVSDERHAVGTTPTEQCFDDDGDEIDESNAQDVAEKTADGAEEDAFCGRLDYNPGTNEYNTESPVDQDLRSADGTDIGTWDVQYASYAGNYGLSTCIPWCLPGTITAYRAAHDALAEQGMADDGETADNEDDQGWQEYAVNTLYPNALIVAQDMTGAWEANGWAHTLHDQQFIGFLYDDEGAVIDADRLKEIHGDANLPADSIPQICGFTPDMEVTIDAPQASFCEVLFKWNAPNDDGAGPVSAVNDGINADSYEDACESPTYVCGANQPAWYAQLVCKTFFSLGSVNPGSFGCGGEDYLSPSGGDGPAWSDNDYDVWHWVVAPSPSACSGAQEPGFQTETSDADAEHPYLAHDLDVYSPAATAADERGTENSERYARDSAAKSLPGVEADQATPSDEELTPTQLQKADRVEPNAPGDDSQSELTFERDADSDPCDVLREGTETYYDDWVNLVDNEVTFDALGEPMGGGFGPYLTDAGHQDASNRPGYSMYYTSGKLGMFTDTNDDGDYDQAGPDNKNDGVNDVGAYPMIWDVYLNEDKLAEDGEPKTDHMEGGCTPGFSDFELSEEAAKAGYGPHTGLLQVVYLNEPTTLMSWITLDVLPYPGGNNAFVFLSDGFEKLYNNPDTQSFVEEKVNEALAHVPAENPNVVYPHQDTADGITDFYDQCAESTGGFTSSWGFTHTCGGEPGGDLCAGDTVVTQYTFENLAADNVLGGGDSNIPLLDVDGDGNGETFPSGINTWTDVDPLDGDPARNNDDCNRPQHHPAGHDDPCGFDDGSHHPS